jgi:hypothetical protein
VHRLGLITFRVAMILTTLRILDTGHITTPLICKDYLTTAKSLNIPDKTAEKHIAKFVQSGLINHFSYAKYKKP